MTDKLMQAAIDAALELPDLLIQLEEAKNAVIQAQIELDELEAQLEGMQNAIEHEVIFDPAYKNEAQRKAAARQQTDQNYAVRTKREEIKQASEHLSRSRLGAEMIRDTIAAHKAIMTLAAALA